jgi:hypothetical protein
MPFGRVFYTGQPQRLMAHQAGLGPAAGGLANRRNLGFPRFTLQILCEDHIGTYFIPFLCRWSRWRMAKREN